MAKNDNLKDFVIDIANAIRSKTGKTEPINPQDFSSEILNISSGASFSLVGDWIWDNYIKLTFTSDGTVTYGDVDETLVLDGTYSVSGYKIVIKLNYGAEIEEVQVEYIPENDTLKMGEDDDVLIFVRRSATNKFSELVEGTITELTREDLANVTEIRYGAFITTPLVKAEIPSNVKIIGGYAFAGCEGLETLTIDDGVEEIGQSAFSYVQAKDIVLPKTISVLKEWVFEENYALESITIPENITEIKADVFRGCVNLTEITMDSITPPSVTSSSFPSSVTAIYVKYGAYDSYKAQWTDYADKIVRLPAIPSTITVTVNNYLNELVNGASVTITGNGQTFTGTTNENGVFVQGDLQPATYTVSVGDLDGFKKPDPSTVEIVVEENTQNSATFTYLEKPAISRVFGENSPASIALVANEIAHKNMTSAEVESAFGWKLGDTIAYTLSTGKIVNMQIIGFNHDNLSDGTGKAGITLQMENCLDTKYTMYNVNRTDGGYKYSVMRTTTLPSIKATIPQEWQNVIKSVEKKSADGGKGYTTTSTTIDDLFLLSQIELFGATATNAQNHDDEGSVYEYWNGKDNSARIKATTKADGRPYQYTSWWLRSANSTDNASFCGVYQTTGGNTYMSANMSNGVSFAFCV